MNRRTHKWDTKWHWTAERHQTPQTGGHQKHTKRVPNLMPKGAKITKMMLRGKRFDLLVNFDRFWVSASASFSCPDPQKYLKQNRGMGEHHEKYYFLYLNILEHKKNKKWTTPCTTCLGIILKKSWAQNNWCLRTFLIKTPKRWCNHRKSGIFVNN